MDGNGRIGRLLVTLLLIDWGLLTQPLLYLSNFIDANRQEYYDRLLNVSQKGDWEGWLLYFLDGVYSQAQDALQRIMRLQELRMKYHAILTGERSYKKLQCMVDYLIGTPILSVTQAQEDLQMGSFTTIQRYIEKLVAVDILREATGKARNRVFQAEEIVRVLEE